MVKACTLTAADPGVRFSVELGFFQGQSQTSDLKIGTLVATLPGTWHYKVIAGTGQLDVNIL